MGLKELSMLMLLFVRLPLLEWYEMHYNYIVQLHVHASVLCIWLLQPGRGAVYCDQFVCLWVSVCPRAYLWNCWTNLVNIFCADRLWLWLGPPLAALWYVMYLLVFMDDVTFGRSGPYGDACLPLAALWYRGGVWCVWMFCWNLWTLYLINLLRQFHQIYNFVPLGDRGEKCTD